MALTLTIGDGTTTINLNDTSDLHMLEGWVPAIARPTADESIPPDVTDVIPCILQISSADNMASGLQKIYALDRLAKQYHDDPSQHKEVWFTRQLTGETNGTRTLVSSLAFVPRLTELGDGGWFDATPGITEGRLGELQVTHHPYWERDDSANNDFVSATPSAAAAIEYDPLSESTVPGDVHCRIEGFNLRSKSGQIDPIDRVWIGVRGANKYGVTPTNFVYVWELEDGTNETSGDTSDYSPE